MATEKESEKDKLFERYISLMYKHHLTEEEYDQLVKISDEIYRDAPVTYWSISIDKKEKGR